MSLYEEGSTVRPILKTKIENILKSEVYEDMVNRLVPLIKFLQTISPTMEGEERKDLNVLNMTVSTIYSQYYAYMTSVNRTRAQLIQNTEAVESIDEKVKQFLNAMNKVSGTFLTKLKHLISTTRSKDRATELFENTYNSLVEDVLNKYTM